MKKNRKTGYQKRKLLKWNNKTYLFISNSIFLIKCYFFFNKCFLKQNMRINYGMKNKHLFKHLSTIMID